MLAYGEVGHSLGQRVAEIGVPRVAPVARPPARVDRQLHQVREPADLPRTGRLAARQRAELVQVDALSTVRPQERVDEGEMSELVLGVVVDVLGHVRVQHRQRIRVGRISASARHFAVLNSPELVVLLPSVGLQDLERRQKTEYRRVSRSRSLARVGGSRVGQQPTPGDRSRTDGSPLEQQGTATGHVLRRLGRFHDLLLCGNFPRLRPPRERRIEHV